MNKLPDIAKAGVSQAIATSVGKTPSVVTGSFAGPADRFRGGNAIKTFNNIDKVVSESFAALDAIPAPARFSYAYDMLIETRDAMSQERKELYTARAKADQQATQANVDVSIA